MNVRNKNQFVPGVSGNPLGRYAHSQRELSAEIRRRAESGNDRNQLIAWLWEIAEGQQVEHPDDGPVQLTSTRDRLNAITELLDRGWGKAPQTVEVDGQIQHTAAPIDVSRLSDDERAQLRNLILRATAPALPKPNL